MARQRRLKSNLPTAVYHCVTRTVNGEFLLDDTAKKVLRKQIHQVAQFCGIEVVTYAVMSNHFHVLVRVPEKGNLSDAELLRRYAVLYPKPTQYATAQIEILKATLKTNGTDAEKLRKQLLARMGNISEFMKTLKQRFSVWFNKTHKRYGTLWAERFTSTIVEGNGHFALQTMAAYIDLNPVRAGLVNDPKDYRWCGYGEAVAQGGPIVKGLRYAMENVGNHNDAELLAAYRVALFGKGAVPKANGARSGVISAETLAREEKRAGKLSVPERLRLKVNWFTRGAVIGSRQFVQAHLADYRRRTAKRRRLEPCAFSRDDIAEWPLLFAMRGGK
ncbi:MAG: transposase [Puniceicoccales bacterium]|nr:transposase [Puniceicoccales bacterium]